MTFADRYFFIYTGFLQHFVCRIGHICSLVTRQFLRSLFPGLRKGLECLEAKNLSRMNTDVFLSLFSEKNYFKIINLFRMFTGRDAKWLLIITK